MVALRFRFLEGETFPKRERVFDPRALVGFSGDVTEFAVVLNRDVEVFERLLLLFAVACLDPNPITFRGAFLAPGEVTNCGGGGAGEVCVWPPPMAAARE